MLLYRYVENGSLLNTLKDFGEFPEALVASYVVKILEGLDHLHRNQVVVSGCTSVFDCLFVDRAYFSTAILRRQTFFLPRPVTSR